MKKVLFVLILSAVAAAACYAQAATSGEMGLASKIRSAEYVPFSFTLGGEPSAKILQRSGKTLSFKVTEKGVTETASVWTDPVTGVEIKYVAHTYDRFPALDWTVYLTNTTSKASPVLDKFFAYDGVLMSDKGDVKIHWDRGGINEPNAFEPMIDLLGSAGGELIRQWPDPHNSTYDNTVYAKAHYEPLLGRGSDRVSSYFDFEGKGKGAIICVGWPGQWTMDAAKSGKDVTVTAGQAELTGTLNPGETVRSPRMVVMYYKGDFVRGQNLWRRFYLTHATPKIDGKPPKARFNFCAGANVETMKRIEKMDVKAEYLWQDAGWYPKPFGDWYNTGTWEISDPEGMKAAFDYSHKMGMKNMLWFEPERVYEGTEFYNNHGDWLIKGDFPDVHWKHEYGNLADYSKPEVVNWFINRIDKIIKYAGVDMYREDFNMSPLKYWQRRDTAERKGFVENAYIQGHLRLWQTLKDRNPGLEIDSCSSGGLRNDYATMCMALPALRTDYEFEPNPEGYQGSFFGSAYWLPLGGIGMRGADLYDFRSTYGGMATAVWSGTVNGRTGKPYDYDFMRKIAEEFRTIKECYTGDYYPLTPWNIDKDKWIAAQFDLPEAGKGIIQAFRRPENKEPAITVTLRGLRPGAKYKFTNRDGGEEIFTGKQLMKGYKLSAPEARTSMIIEYTKL
ncbi:MAG: alpha-galactosidase [Abditibacteriota bacterium]|nr:alpha-galactosidase [Abditibacteriota bacterium]